MATDEASCFRRNLRRLKQQSEASGVRLAAHGEVVDGEAVGGDSPGGAEAGTAVGEILALGGLGIPTSGDGISMRRE